MTGQPPCPCQNCRQSDSPPSDAALVALALICAALLVIALLFTIWWARRHPEHGAE